MTSMNAYRNDDRYLLIDDTDEDATEILSIICDGDPRSNRGFDFDGRRKSRIKAATSKS